MSAPPIELDADPPPGDDPAGDPPAPVAARAARFCAACGSPWRAGWDDCGACAASRPAAVRSDSDPAGEGRAVGPALALYFSLLGVSLAGAVVAVARGEPLTPGEDLVLTAVFTAVVAGWCVPNVRRVAPLLRRVGPLKWYAAALAAAPLTFGLAHLSVSALVHLTGVPELRYTPEFLAAGYPWWTIVVAVCVQPAVFEELAFRGAVDRGLRQTLDARESLVVTSLLFAILHLSIPSLPHLFALALVLGALVRWSGSLYPAMALHFGHNLLCILSERWADVPPT